MRVAAQLEPANPEILGDLLEYYLEAPGFLGGGFDKASTNRIAEVAGVSVGSLYQYFPSKEALVAALVERHIEHMSEALQAEMATLADAPLALTVRRMLAHATCAATSFLRGSAGLRRESAAIETG